ncbi:MAG: N-acetylglucosamine-6-phosphate deacetylase [Gammaproteobacteria bacterium]
MSILFYLKIDSKRFFEKKLSYNEVMQKLLLQNLNIHTQTRSISDAAVYIENGTIREICHMKKASQFKDCKTVNFPSNYHIIPGMIDMHIHGCHGVDVMDATPEAIEHISRQLPQQGTTAFLATTMTQTEANIAQAIQNIAKHRRLQFSDGAEVVGIHLEGPFISPKKVGAHKKDLVRHPDIQLFNEWQTHAEGAIRCVTVAPEVSNALEFICHLKERGVIASIGHTNATYQQTLAGIRAGATHATHLFNAMSGLHHRSPGAVLAILEQQDILAELIADGLHVSAEMLAFALQCKSVSHCCLVTDSMRAACMGEGEYELSGQKVIVKEGVPRLADGTIAGSVLTMIEAFQNIMRLTSCSIHDAISLTSYNPARQLGLLNRKGSLAIGKEADLVILDNDYNVVSTYCCGKLAYQM